MMAAGYTVRTVTDEGEIAQFFQFADPILQITDHEALGPVYQPKQIAHAIAEDQRQLFFLEKDGTFVGGYFAAILPEERRKDLGVRDGQKAVLFEFAAGIESERGKGHAGVMEIHGLEWAKRQKADLIVSEVATYNAHSLYWSFVKGYLVLGTEHIADEPPYYVLHKYLNGQPEEAEDGEIVNVLLTEFDRIERLLQRGAIGIALRQLGNKESTDLADWEMVLWTHKEM